MSSPRPFAAHQFGLLHLLGLVSLCRTDGDPGSEEEDAMDAPQRAATLHLPQELMVNVLCYLTEQIHEVSSLLLLKYGDARVPVCAVRRVLGPPHDDCTHDS